MLEISAERIVQEVNKILLTRNGTKVIEALDSFRSFLIGIGDIEQIQIVLDNMGDDLAFVWAFLLNFGEEKYRFSKEFSDRIRMFQVYADSNPQHNPIELPQKQFDDILMYQMTMIQVRKAQYQAALSPYINAEEKVRGLGFDGNYFLSKGITGKAIGQNIKYLQMLVESHPYSTKEYLEEKLTFSS